MANAFDEADAALIRDDVPKWAAALFEGRQPEIASRYSERLREKIAQVFVEGAEWIEGVRASPPRELDALIEEKIATVARATTPLEPWPYVAIALLVAAGVLLESRKRAFDR